MRVDSHAVHIVIMVRLKPLMAIPHGMLKNRQHIPAINLSDLHVIIGSDEHAIEKMSNH